MKKIVIFSIILSIFGFKNVYGIGYGIPKSENHERPYPGNEINSIIDGINNYYIGNDNKKIYLTFDMGYENGYTLDILETLKSENINACFFITGHYLKSNVDLVKKMFDENHIVANHTLHHKNLTKLSDLEIIEEVKNLENECLNLTGYKMSNYVRPPAGVFDKRVLEVLNNKGYKNIFWSLAYVDWKIDEQKGKEYAYNNVISRIHNGAIILMHGVSKDNNDALKDIIVELKKQGYIFSSLDEL